VFGAALLYDETFDSFKWLFEAFLKAHNGQQPKAFYTDQDVSMGKTVAQVFGETWHGLCTFHKMQNAIKHLHEEKNEEEKKDKNKKAKKKVTTEEETEEEAILSDFSACMFEYEDIADIAELEQNFNLIRQKVSKQTWLDSIYKLKEKWAACYMKEVFTLGMSSTQLSESLNNHLKIHFKSDFDMIRFFKHFERVVQEKRILSYYRHNMC
jgi:zinc finger SWIM domain-containing protein 3